MEQIFSNYGIWFWFVAAILLLIGELLNPGVFLMWLAAAAALTGVIHLAYPMSLAAEALLFAVFAGLLIAASWRLVSKSWHPKSDQPFLNQRQQGLVGKTFNLLQPIVNGQGKIRYEDTIWDVDGPELAKNARVKVIAVDGLRLTVEAA